MSSKLIPASPADVMVIRDVTPNITTLSVPFSRFGRVEIGGRCTIVRMSSGGVVVFSPVALTAEAQAVVERLGGGKGVKYLVAPDMEHHIFISEWAKAYPEVRIIGPQGLPEKRAETAGKDAKINVDDAFFAVLPDKQDPVQAVSIAPDFDADFATVYIDTMANKEIVMLFRADRVLLEADVIFNLPALEQYEKVPLSSRVAAPGHANLVNRLFKALISGPGTTTTRFLVYLSTYSNRQRFNEAIRIVDGWDFDTIIPCHGEVVKGNGKQFFRDFFSWHVPAAEK